MTNEQQGPERVWIPPRSIDAFTSVRLFRICKLDGDETEYVRSDLHDAGMAEVWNTVIETVRNTFNDSATGYRPYADEVIRALKVARKESSE